VRFSIVTLFPDLFAPFVETSMVGRAVKGAAIRIDTFDLRGFGLGKHRNVDDTPYGGGSGMVLRVEPIVAALERVDEAAGDDGPAHRVLLTPQGAPFCQATARTLAARRHVALVCGRYEGFDERVRSFVQEEISLGDFVMTGGEVAAMAIIEASSRLLPNVLGNEASTIEESFAGARGDLLEYPHYTRPVEFRGHVVPEVLQQGNHAAIAKWRTDEAVARTRVRRPDLAEPSRGAPKPEGDGES
jgi:tRNA (guanine37-N1)-methyltransferase